ncbi:hypothetical protein [Goodfellowiella coeruleoviolacea]|uniref:Uncharacterized protein n=1 Tax=Goodfellowiella coeruleoviolacea TaxID=334858 RepID=A0AAE3KK67_9PSEU|nr:hypothetical protein [Goodfellowiella coeruleoviolacea]MCP2169852.1 hypothetical protein [Goodfellowiella coeruleoviolacea]
MSPLWTFCVAAGALVVGIAIGLLWTCRDVHGEHSAYAPECSVAAVLARVRADVVHFGQSDTGAAEGEPVTEPLYRVSVRLTAGRGQLDPAVFQPCAPLGRPARQRTAPGRPTWERPVHQRRPRHALVSAAAEHPLDHGGGPTGRHALVVTG